MQSERVVSSIFADRFRSWIAKRLRPKSDGPLSLPSLTLSILHVDTVVQQPSTFTTSDPIIAPLLHLAAFQQIKQRPSPS